MKCSIRNILLLLFTIISLVWFECAMYAALHLSWYGQPWFYGYQSYNDKGSGIVLLLIVFPALFAFLLFRLVIWAIFQPGFKYLWSALAGAGLVFYTFSGANANTLELIIGGCALILLIAAPYWDFSTMRDNHRRAVSAPKNEDDSATR